MSSQAQNHTSLQNFAFQTHDHDSEEMKKARLRRCDQEASNERNKAWLHRVLRVEGLFMCVVAASAVVAAVLLVCFSCILRSAYLLLPCFVP